MTSHIHRKKPQAKNNTWSCSSSSYYLNSLNKQQLTTTFSMTSMPIKERIDSYEHKYQTCMQSRTLLSHWIKANKEKGLPEPLTEGYSPPSRSRLPDFLFSSLSTRSKRKCEQPNNAISSISTFLKKATTIPPNHRFSLTSSLNRFSLQKNVIPEKFAHEGLTAEMLISAPDVTNNKKQMPQSSILPHSPSSVFLDKLRSRTPSQDGGDTGKLCHGSFQPNTATTSKFARIITHGDFTQDDTITPPSSPSSTESSSLLTPPLISQFNHHHYLRQSGKSVTAEKKKKRASLLITPSLSTIRLLPQKSHFLKRQSMLA